MSYEVVSLKIEPEIWGAMPKGERCQIIRQFCRNYVNTQKGSLNDINLEILSMQITQLRNNVVKDSAELQSKEQLLIKVKESIEERRQEELELQKKKIEESKHCKNCGNFLDGKKTYTFKIGSICQGCYSSMTNEQFKRWNNGGDERIHPIECDLPAV